MIPTKACLGAVCALAILAVASRADLLYFKDAGELQATASVSGDRVEIELGEARYEFLRTDFRKLVPGFDPAREVSDRFKAARISGLPARHAAVWWAIENGLIDQAAPELKALHQADPKHAATARMAAALDRLALPAADPDVAAFQKALGVSMSTASGPHVLLLHQRTEDEAAARVALLENIIAGYWLFFSAQGIELESPPRKLVFAWFSEQTDYVSFLRAQNAAVFSTTRGYFHPTWNAVVAYDARGTEKQRDGRATASARRTELKRFRDSVDRLPARSRLRVSLSGETPRIMGKADAMDLADRLERRVRRDELLLDAERRAIDDGTAAHEIVHLLAANTGLLPRHDSFPRWLQEGLAMQFELIRGGRWAGISRPHDLRLPDWRKIQPPPALDRLIRDIDFRRGYQRDSYAQAWALVYFLRTQHPVEFLKYLDLLRSPDTTLTELSSPDRYLATFRRAFGPDLEAIEQNWHAYLATVQTPLERHAPTPPRPPAQP